MPLAYRIEYGSAAEAHAKTHWVSHIFMTCLFFSIFLAAVSLFWPEGREVLRILLIPGTPDSTMQAAETFVSELDCGSRITGAAYDFFQKLMGNEAVY